MGLASKVNAGGPPAAGPPAGGPPPGGMQQSGAPPGGFPGQQGGAQPGAGFGGAPPARPSGYPPQQSMGGQPGQQAMGAPPGQQAGYPGQQSAPPQQQQPYGGAPGGQGGMSAGHGAQQGYGAPGAQQGPGANQFGQQQPPQQQFGQQAPPQQGFGAPGGAPQGGAPNAQYAGTHGLMGAPGAAGSVMPVVQQKLTNMVRANRLEGFFPNGLGNVFNRLNCVDFKALSQKWNMPLELATDLSQLALYDIVIFADDSGSMVFEERGERIDDLKLILGRVAEVATLFDDDGILVRFMNSTVEGNGIRDANAAQALIGQIQFNGMTPLGTNLESKVIRPFLLQGIQRRDLAKPILVICITDGEPVGEPPGSVKRVIFQAKQAASQSHYGPGAIAFQFAQVGKDVKAQRFLGELDNDPEVGTSIDATSYYELEAEEYARKGVTLTPELWLVKLMVGAIDSSYDEQD